MSDRLGFALIGCGEISELNARSIAAADGAHLTLVVDTNADAAKRLADAHDVRWSTSLESALSDPEVQAVFLATPHHLHAPMIEAAARAGRQIIVEKPIATSVEAAEAARSVCEDAGVHLSVCHPRRYESRVSFARDLFDAGVIGRLLTTSTRFLKAKTSDYWSTATWRGTRSRSGGGVLLMNLIHHIDTLQVVTGCSITDAFAFCSTLHTDVEVEDTVAMTLRYDNGAVGTMTACSSAPGPRVFEDAIYGTQGRLVIGKKSVSVFSLCPNEHVPIDEWTEFPYPNDPDHKTRFVAAFAQSIAAGNSPPVSASYGIGILSLVERVYTNPNTYE